MGFWLEEERVNRMGYMTELDADEVPKKVWEMLQPNKRQYICCLGTYGDDDIYYCRARGEDFDDGVCEAPAAFYNPKTSECRPASTPKELDAVYGLLLANGGFDEDEEEEYDDWGDDDYWDDDDEDDDWDCDWRDDEEDDDSWSGDYDDDEDEEDWIDDVPAKVLSVLKAGPGQYICCLGTCKNEEVYYCRTAGADLNEDPGEAPAAFYDPKTAKCRLASTKKDKEAVHALLALYGGFYG